MEKGPFLISINGFSMDNPRYTAVKILQSLYVDRESLSKILPTYVRPISNEKEKAWIQEICYGVARFYDRLDFIAHQLLEKKTLKSKDIDIYLLILTGIYQLLFMRVPPYAAVDETVKVARLLKKSWATRLINALLRNFLRNQETLLRLAEENLVARYAHPSWLIHMLQQAWPSHWPSILIANNEHPPLTLRVNTRLISKDAYLERLKQSGIQAQLSPFCPTALMITQAMEVFAIPGFQQGYVTVQDASAQLAAELLDLKPGQCVLDACAAPGGKLTHILEKEPALQAVIGIDNKKSRLALIRDNLKRLNLTAELADLDITKLSGKFQKEYFDRILLDAPCSSTGVIRRHPDIKWLRKPEDIQTLSIQQEAMLQAAWKSLKLEGKLLYATCSVLPEENEQVIEAFLKKTPDAKAIPIIADWGIIQQFGRQILPGQYNMDGFYYALLEKSRL